MIVGPAWVVDLVGFAAGIVDSEEIVAGGWRRIQRRNLTVVGVKPARIMIVTRRLTINPEAPLPSLVRLLCSSPFFYYEVRDCI